MSSCIFSSTTGKEKQVVVREIDRSLERNNRRFRRTVPQIPEPPAVFVYYRIRTKSVRAENGSLGRATTLVTWNCECVKGLHLVCSMKVEQSLRGGKKGAPRSRGRGQRKTFQKTDLMVTLPNEESKESRLKPPVSSTQPRKIVRISQNKTGELKICLPC